MQTQTRNHDGTEAPSYQPSHDNTVHAPSLPQPQLQRQAGGSVERREQDYHTDPDNRPTSHGKFGSHINIDDLFHEVRDQILQRVFGERVAQAIAQRIQATIQESMDRGIDDAQAYSSALTKILGSGAAPIERLILKNIYTSLEQDFHPRPGYSLPDHIHELKHRVTTDPGSRRDE